MIVLPSEQPPSQTKDIGNQNREFGMCSETQAFMTSFGCFPANNPKPIISVNLRYSSVKVSVSLLPE
jgi:hypothetical protein